MVRRSQRVSTSASSTPAHKRAASNGTPAGSTAKRSRKSAAPTKPQKRGIPDDNDEDDDDDDDEDLDETSADDSAASEYGGNDDEDEEEAIPTDTEESADEEESEEEVTPRKKGGKRKSNSTSTVVHSQNGELWKSGDTTGMGPGVQVIIKKPKARAAGKTPYADDKIHPNTMLFLKDLKANNDRQWLKMHDPDFRQSERDWFSFVEKLTEKLIEIDDTVPELPVKDVIFRIYRDVRFSSDPTPYKPHFSAAWSRTGRKGPYAHYYVQISPHNSFVGGGLWHPEAAPTAAMRRDIDRHPRRIKDVLLNDRVRKDLLGGVGKVDSKVVKAFVSSNSENALKTKPKGFDANHPDIELLRLRNYTIGRKLTESEVTAPGGLETIAGLLTALKPFVTYLNSVVMPDPSEDSDSDDDGSDDASEESADDEGEGNDEDEEDDDDPAAGSE